MRIPILVVEDDPFQCEHLLSIFQDLGVENVCIAESGAEALIHLEENEIELVISDLMMPDIDGIQLIQKFKNLKQVPVLALVSSAPLGMLNTASLVARAYGVTVLGLISKPIRSMAIQKLLYKLKNCYVSRTGLVSRGPLSFTKDDIEKALLAGQFCSWYQPKVSLSKRKIVSAEALVRWLHPVSGLLQPSSFMPAIKEFGLEEKILMSVLKQAVQAQAEWRKMGFCVPVSINLPPHLLDDCTLVDRLEAFVLEIGGDTSQFIFELLESSVTTSLGAYYAGACRLRMKGFGLAQDDFGQGYSSLYSLVSTPFTELKVDRVLIHDCGTDERLVAALESAMKLANRLGLDIVAEGVECNDELDVLRSLNFDVIQGYLISKPLSMSEFSSLLRCEEVLLDRVGL
ncbi:TPA: EAL domain-containing response regulator [Pseudomonas aeruginosa]